MDGLGTRQLPEKVEENKLKIRNDNRKNNNSQKRKHTGPFVQIERMGENEEIAGGRKHLKNEEEKKKKRGERIKKLPEGEKGKGKCKHHVV